jgi:hypothetical protein
MEEGLGALEVEEDPEVPIVKSFYDAWVGEEKEGGKRAVKKERVAWHHPPAAYDFLRLLLSPESEDRLALYRKFKSHSFFHSPEEGIIVDWEMVERKQVCCYMVYVCASQSVNIPKFSSLISRSSIHKPICRRMAPQALFTTQSSLHWV